MVTRVERTAARTMAIAFAAGAGILVLQTALLQAIPFDAPSYASVVDAFRLAFPAVDLLLFVAFARLARADHAVRGAAAAGAAAVGLSLLFGIVSIAAHRPLGARDRADLRAVALVTTSMEPAFALAAGVLALVVLVAIAREAAAVLAAPILVDAAARARESSGASGDGSRAPYREPDAAVADAAAAAGAGSRIDVADPAALLRWRRAASGLGAYAAGLVARAAFFTGATIAAFVAVALAREAAAVLAAPILVDAAARAIMIAGVVRCLGAARSSRAFALGVAALVALALGVLVDALTTFGILAETVGRSYSSVRGAEEILVVGLMASIASAVVASVLVCGVLARIAEGVAEPRLAARAHWAEGLVVLGAAAAVGAVLAIAAGSGAHARGLGGSSASAVAMIAIVALAALAAAALTTNARFVLLALVKKLLAGALLVGMSLLAAARPAAAFCGFYVGGANAKLFNEATVVVLMREGTRTVLSMQNAYKGPPERFAMVVPVPVVLQEENVKTLPRELFDKIDQLAAPRLVEYWEQDPCSVGGRGHVRFKGVVTPQAAPPSQEASGADLGVKIEAEFTVGEYQIVILSAQDSVGLDTWLRREGYVIPEQAEPYFRPYVASGSKFFVARVDVAKVKTEGGVAVLSPLRFHYDSDEFRLPVRLGLINSSGTQDLIVHVLARGKRYEVANYPNVTIPTNLDVSEAAQGEFGRFYAALFDRTIEKNPRAVVTEYAWDSSTCDPCPGPTLDAGDLATLGADALERPRDPRVEAIPRGSRDASAVPGPPALAPAIAPRRSFPGGFTLTRLHARYTKDALGEDLVFREAEPIVGGREVRDRSGKLEHAAQPTKGVSNFQARYAIRHPWTGPIDCKEPVRGVWGGPPGDAPGSRDGDRPKVAKKLGLVPRTAIDLASLVKSDVPEIGLVRGASARGGDRSTGAAGEGEAGAGASKRGCLGCAIADADDEANGKATMRAAFVAALGAIALAMRRARRTSSSPRGAG